MFHRLRKNSVEMKSYLVYIFILLGTVSCTLLLDKGTPTCPRQQLEEIMINDYTTMGHNSPISYSFIYDTLDTCIINWLALEYRFQSKYAVEFPSGLKRLKTVRHLNLGGVDNLSSHNIRFFVSLLKELDVEYTNLSGPLLTKGKTIVLKDIPKLIGLSYFEPSNDTLRIIDTPRLNHLDIFDDKNVKSINIYTTNVAIDTISLSKMEKNISFNFKNNKKDILHFFIGPNDSNISKLININTDKNITAYIHQYDSKEMKYPVIDTLYIKGAK
jgi:hypothetical protein